jgi:hypothetical protein
MHDTICTRTTYEIVHNVPNVIRCVPRSISCRLLHLQKHVRRSSRKHRPFLHSARAREHSALIQRRSTSAVPLAVFQGSFASTAPFEQLLRGFKMNTKLDNPATVLWDRTGVLPVAFMPHGPDHQRRSVLCNSEAVTARRSKPTAGPTAKRRDAPARQCAPACCCQNTSNASRVSLGSF